MIESFKGEYAFLSNFARIDLILKGKLWPTSEHMYMACKTTDQNMWEQIRKCPTPGQAKKLGRQVTLRPNWEQVKDKYMLKCLKIKFTQNATMRQKLLDTGDQLLVEKNHWHDNYWGSCSCLRCGNHGKNMLGKLLMQVRTGLQKGRIKEVKHDPFA
jgi:N-glycosidase YbiA